MRHVLAWIPAVIAIAGVALACGSDASTAGPASTDAGVDGANDDANDDASSAADWTIALTPGGPPAGKVSSALLGQYDLSGALLAYDTIAGLPAAMKAVGMKDWRVGVGRWEVTTRLLPKLTDGNDCSATLAAFPSLVAPPSATDLTLATSRDWFVDDGQPVTLAATDDDARYSLGYLRSVLDVAAAFGARPLVNVDHMPRAFAQNKTFSRVMSQGDPTPCTFTWTNGVSNCRPADEYLVATSTTPPIFPSAVVGMVKRIADGTGGDKPRAATDWELWNEPDLPYAWDPAFDDMQHTKYFQTMAETLVLLDAYRTQSAKPLRFGLGSFAHAAYAAAVLKGLDSGTAAVPVDFFSFHSYSNDPLVIVSDIESMVAARSASKRYAKAELLLTEWGVDLGAPPPDGQIDGALLVATVIALGATAGLDRAYHSLFYDFVPGLPFGLVDHDVKPKPLYRAYELLTRLLSAGGNRFAIEGAPSGRFDGGEGAAIAVRDPSGKLRVLVVNRGAAPRTVRVVLDGALARAASVSSFDDAGSAVHALPSPSAAIVTVAPRSIALLEL